MNDGWWWLMIGLILFSLASILYTGVFLVWLHKYGGARGLTKEIQRRLRSYKERK